MAWHANVLVVANVTAASDALLSALQARAERGPIRLTLLMPAAGLGHHAREAAEERLQEALERWRAAGLEATGVVGDSEPMHALSEIWDPRRFDEVVVSTLPGASSRWLRFDFPHRVAQATGVPVTHVVAPPPAVKAPGAPAPRRAPDPLGPLAVLAWGGRPERPERPEGERR
jgi:hypothetical protein